MSSPPSAASAKSAVQAEGGEQVSREIEFFNLEIAISAGCRVKLHLGTQFRVGSTQRLRV